MTTQSGNSALAAAQDRAPESVDPCESRGRHRQARNAGYCVRNIADFQMAKFADPDNLYRAFLQLERHGGHGAGTDGFRPEHFSKLEIFAILREVSAAINNGTYRPYEPRICVVPKSSGGTRELAIYQFMDRTVAKALQNCLSPFWKQHFVAPSVWQIYASLHWSIHRREIYVLATDDIRQCFDNASLCTVMARHRDHILHEELLALIERIILGHDVQGRGIGLLQGSPYSPVAMELLLHHVLDSEMELRAGNTPRFRYVDNLAYLCPSVSEGIRVLSIASEVLDRAGFELKGVDGAPQDLRDPRHEKVYLGRIPRWQNGQLTTLIPESAYESLMLGLQIANSAAHPADNAWRRCAGWIRDLSPTLTRQAEREVVDRVVTMARHSGFRNVTCPKLREVVVLARSKWQEVLENARRGVFAQLS